MNKFMKMAIDEARKGIKEGHGGPFGAVVVKNGEVVAKGHNKVVLNNDPTCHGEIDAIRKACKKLGTFDLDGCEIYTTGYPCPMCFGAIMWSSIDRIYYGCDLKENEEIGFSDKIFDKTTKKEKMQICERVDHKECRELFEEYLKIDNKTMY